MDLRDIHYGYIVDIMEQDPGVIHEMCEILDEIDIMMFVCDVDIAVCETLVSKESIFITDIEKWLIELKKK